MEAEPTTATRDEEPERPAAVRREDEQPGFEITRTDVVCLGPIVVLMLWNLVMTPFAPSLLGPHPILLETIRGSQSALLAAGAAARTGSTPLWVVCVAPIVILMLADPFLYWAGRRYGRRIVEHLATQDPRWHRRLARSEGWFRRWGVWTIAFGYYIPFVPATLFYLAAGESRMPFRTFILADLAGTLTWIGIHVGVGYAAGKTATDAAQAISRYGLWLAVAIIVGGVGWGVWSQLRARPTEVDPA